MKKVVLIVLMVVVIFMIFVCGFKLDKIGEEFKDFIIKDFVYGDEYLEDSFSFLMYKDKDINCYLVDIWVFVKDEFSVLEYFYYYDEDKQLDSIKSKVIFDDMKVSGNYEVIYKLGKFKQKFNFNEYLIQGSVN